VSQARHAGTLVVAVDGPSGSGKSTISRGVAERLGLRYLDTGATYRAVTWLVLQRGVDPADGAATEALARQADLQVGTDPREPWVRIDGTDVTTAVRGPEVTAAVSAVSASPGVRRALVDLQRAVAADGDRGIVVEGRDISAVVLPDADVKVFLTASGEVRAARRAAETASAAPDSVAVTLADLQRRDRLDSSRAASPLTRAPGAVELDSTELGIDEVVDRVVGLCESAGRTAGRA
jgi:CMP/dCMP kinase